MKTVLLDLSNVAWATFHSSIQNDKTIFTDEDKLRLWKHFMLTSIIKIRSKHKPDEFIICVDSKSWRYKYFRFYKARRNLRHKKSGAEYQYFINGLNEFVNDLEVYFPYKVVKVNWAEADDIIAVLVHELADKRDEIIIASRDKDFKQLLRSNVRLWDTVDHEYKTCEDPKEYLIRHVLMGDAGDDIPNVRSDDDVFITEGKRQKPCGPKAIDKIFQEGIEEYIRSNNLIENFKRNRRLIMLKRPAIPEKIWNRIIDEYNNKTNREVDYMTIVKYLGKNKLKQLSSQIDKLM